MSALTDSSAVAGGTAMSVGQLLRTRRIERGLSIGDIAAETRISARYLSALEDDQHEVLPPLTFSLGFVKNYAKALGLSSELVGNQFKAETSRFGVAEQAHFPEPMGDSKIPSRGLAVAGVAIVVAVLGGWWAWTSGLIGATAPTEDDMISVAGTAEGTSTEGPDLAISATPPDTEAVSAPQAAAVPADEATLRAEEQATAAARVINNGPIILKALEDSWVRISDGTSGAVKIGVMKAGETYRVPALPGLKLMTGNAGALEVTVGTTVLPSMGGPGEVVKDLELTPAGLQAYLASRATPSSADSPRTNPE